MISIIDENSSEIEKVYQFIQDFDIASIAICSSEKSEGVTSIASALAMNCVMHKNKTLLVDFNLASPDITNKFSLAFNHKDSFEEEIKSNIFKTQYENLYVFACPSNSAHITEYKNRKALKDIMQDWSNQFDKIIIDTSSVNTKSYKIIAAENIAVSANACLLVVLSSKTIEENIRQSMQKLIKIGTNIIGCIMNDQYAPRLADELIRETRRLDKVLPKAMRWCRKKIKNSNFLNLDI